ncbi:GATA zinc finger domain-containing protein 1 [Octopus bimaculoides]|uniref:GATA zinc finger domain-containing protein 1 n=1 Tax=Octopus bimaculoides TaxID=37653 RepID=A0A0L8H7B1_OCTBM|nr:GATA zinc finger domain-containing protein 1 [Octopus bimaculoides]|eukprot:XP_014775127.1 PREDICTED: GATA zinc finger domain-containing protein 1-like [Octopus bimaculoides]
MPFGMKPVCSSCKSTSSTMWRKGSQGEILCNSCGVKSCNKDNPDGATGSTTNSTKNSTSHSSSAGPVLRKSSRIRPTKNRIQTTSKSLGTKGKSRRNIFKKTHPIKAPTAVSTIVSGDSVFYNGLYYQVGDIVSLLDDDGQSVYYAQLRGLLQDQYNEKSAVISWLLPTQSSPKNRFDPSTYILGPEEDLPRKLEFMEFVCHAPSDYYKCFKQPYPCRTNTPELSYVWSPFQPCIRIVPSKDEIFDTKHCPKKTEKLKPDKKDKHTDKEKETH